MYVCIDFDGTIAEHQYPLIGPAVPGAFKWMKKWQEAGIKLILWTMRSDLPQYKTLSEAVEFCKENGVEFFGVNENPTQHEWTDSPKAYAHQYVDDAAYGCPLLPSPTGATRPIVNWEIVGPAILRMQQKDHDLS